MPLSSLFDEKLKSPGDLVASRPQSLDDISPDENEQDLVLRRLAHFEKVDPTVDYSDFSNFVFFNSALDYFNITGEKILNEFPYDGTVSQLQQFSDDLDGYQRFVLDSQWPRAVGHLRFDPQQGRAFVLVDDVGVKAGIQRSSMLSPGTGSISVEVWCEPPPALTGSDDVMFLVQKASGSSGYSVYFSGSTVNFSFSSGSTSGQVSAVAVPGSASYYACVFDRSLSMPVISIMTGSSDSFPVVVSSASLSIVGPVNLGPTRFSMASGSLSGKRTVWLTGSLDDVRVWDVPLYLSDITSSFNTKVYAQDGLVASWRFNETRLTSSLYPVGSEDATAFDYSGHKLNGRIQSYFFNLRASGSIVPFDTSDIVMALNSPEVQDFVSAMQSSGSVFDRNNDNLITHMLPEQFFILEDEKNTQVLENFIYVLARQFDELKVMVDQFIKVLRSNYTRFGQTPDALLPDVARFFGWDFTGNFLNADAFQYLLGKGVLSNLESNKELDTKLFEIKNQFWRRTLNNLIYLYKTKGTRESVESLLRVYGVNRNLVKLKEYGLKPHSGISTFRISSEKSSFALTFGSGTYSGSNYVRSEPFRSRLGAVEARVRFPTTSSSGLTASVMTGSIWTMMSASAGNPMVYRLTFARSDLGSSTGSLHLSSSSGDLAATDVGIFDDRWHNVSVIRDARSGSFVIDVRAIDDVEVSQRDSATTTVGTFDSGSQTWIAWLGSTGSVQSQMWLQEFRAWSDPLSDVELDDHALNFQSYGTEEVGWDRELDLHWRLQDDSTASSGGTFIGTVADVSGHAVSGSGYGFMPSANPFRKFLNDYNFIAPPDYGWNDEKIRVIPATDVGPGDLFVDQRMLSLEFNLVDALNEDISQVFATMDVMNEHVGQAANKFRDTYPSLDSMRETYFRRLQGSLNFRVFADMLEFFDRSFVDMVRRLVPANAIFLGDEFVVESHMLERPKLQWNYRRAPVNFEPLGVIRVIVRT